MNGPLAVQSALPSISEVLFCIADPDLQQDPSLPRCCLSKWSLQELFAKCLEIPVSFLVAIICCLWLVFC